MSSRERRNHATRYHTYRSAQDVERDKFYEDEIMRYEGETLTIESITVGLWDAQVSALVRYGADTAFSITIYKAQWELFTAAGYTLPSRATHDKGTNPFTAEIICEWRKALYGREISLHGKSVEPKEGTIMEVPNREQEATLVKAGYQVRRNEKQETYALAPDGTEIYTSAAILHTDGTDISRTVDEAWAACLNHFIPEPLLAVVETPAVAATPDYAAIVGELSRLRDMLANAVTILGLTGDELTVATAKANAAHYIDNAIGSLTRAIPVPLISRDDITERIPVMAETVTDVTEIADDAAAVTVEQPIKREYHFTKADGTPVVRYWTDEEYDQIIYDTYQSQEDEEYVEDMFWYGTDEDYDNALEVQRNRKQKPPDGKHAA